MSEITRILPAAQEGDPKAVEELLALVYDELRRLAASKLAREPQGQTLQPTALVHEVWLRLVGAEGTAQFHNCAHFFSAAAEAMRRILIDNARRKQRLRHGGGLQRVDLTNLDVANPEDDVTNLAVSEALDKFAERDKVGAELIKLRFFGGLSNVEAARALGLSERTAKRDWAYARAWLYEELKQNLSGR
jgi:RNA polymerase sigma factor (TIGR02999 family)